MGAADDQTELVEGEQTPPTGDGGLPIRAWRARIDARYWPVCRRPNNITRCAEKPLHCGSRLCPLWVLAVSKRLSSWRA